MSKEIAQAASRRKFLQFLAASSAVTCTDALALAETVEAVTGARPAFEMCPGLLETRWYARKGIPAFAYGPGFLEVAHGPNEVVEIERMYQHTIIYALAAARLLADGSSGAANVAGTTLDERPAGGNHGDR